MIERLAGGGFAGIKRVVVEFDSRPIAGRAKATSRCRDRRRRGLIGEG
jgi:hypothetical protein